MQLSFTFLQYFLNFIYLAVLSLNCSMWDLSCHR